MAEIHNQTIFEQPLTIDPRLPKLEITGLDSWLDLVVDHPITAYQTATHNDGSAFTREEQIGATKDNLKKMVREHQELRSHEKEIYRKSALSDAALERHLMEAVQEQHLTNLDKFPESDTEK